MKTKLILRTVMIFFIVIFVSCSKEDEPQEEIVYTKVCWTIIDDITEEPIQGAKMTVWFNYEGFAKSFESDNNGIACYSFGNLSFFRLFGVRAEGYQPRNGSNIPDVIRLIPLEE